MGGPSSLDTRFRGSGAAAPSPPAFLSRDIVRRSALETIAVPYDQSGEGAAAPKARRRNFLPTRQILPGRSCHNPAKIAGSSAEKLENSIERKGPNVRWKGFSRKLFTLWVWP